jgi:uncharacterized membrane protein
MIRIGTFFALFVVSMFVGWNAMNWAIPKVIMIKVMEGLAERGAGVNTMTRNGPPDPYRQLVVRPSPDLLYSTCVYDLDGGPLRINIGPTNGYLSVSFYDHITNNYETLTGDLITQQRSNIILVQKGQDASSGPHVITSPSEKGLVLVRRRISGKDSLPDMQAAQANDACATLTL